MIKTKNRCQSARNHRKNIKNEKKLPTTRSRSESPVKILFPKMKPKLLLAQEKFCKIRTKIVNQLELVKNLSRTKRNECENILDLRRQLQRAEEFSIRFSRNNLYETKRIIKEIEKILTSSFDNIQPQESKSLSKKIILGYQAASQSLQTYANYIKNPVNLEIPEKISELILLISELFSSCKSIFSSSEEIKNQNDALEICNELIIVLKTKPPIGEYLDLKKEVLIKKKQKILTSGKQNLKECFVYE
mgnify:CR=1 FL=1